MNKEKQPKQKCCWCGHEDLEMYPYPVTKGMQEGFITVCNSQCGNEFLLFHNRFGFRAKYMRLSICFFLCLGVIVGMFSAGNVIWGVFLAIAGSGFAVALFPFTPGFNSGLLSPKNSIRLARIMSLILILLGIAVPILIKYYRLLG